MRRPGLSVKTAEGAVRLDLYTGGLKLRLFAGMDVRAETTGPTATIRLKMAILLLETRQSLLAVIVSSFAS